MTRAIPSPQSNQIDINRAVKENLEILFGMRGAKIDRINTSGMSGNDLTFASKINEIIDRLQ